MGPFGCKASCTFQCGKKHLWSLLSIFACFYGECSQILGQVLMKMWKWDYVRRKNDSPASKDSLQKRVYFSTALWQKLCFSTRSNKKDLKGFFDNLRSSSITYNEIRKGLLFFLLNHLMEFCWLISFDLPKAILSQKIVKCPFQLFLTSALLHNSFVTSDDLSILDPNVLLSKRERKGSHLTSVTRPVMGGLVIILNVKAMS